MRCDWACWLRRAQSNPHTADTSDSSLDKNSHNKGRGTRPSAVAFKVLLRLVREAGPSSGFGSPGKFL